MLSSTSSSKSSEARAVPAVRPLWNILFLGLLVAGLLSAGVFWGVRDGKWQMRSMEGRELSLFPASSLKPVKAAARLLLRGQPRQTLNGLSDGLLSPFLGRVYQRQVEAAASDQFPLRIPFIALAKQAQGGLIRAAYLPLHDTALPASPGSNVMVLRHGYGLLPAPTTFDASVQANIDARLANYRDLIARYPQVHFYVFYIDRINVSPLHPAAALFPQADNGRSFRYFALRKPPGLTLTTLPLDSFADYQENFFLSDHHLTALGSWKSYQIVYNMLAPNYPNIGPMLVSRGIKPIPGLGFCGSWARTSFYPCEPEPFTYLDVDLPPYETSVDGVPQPYGQRAAYLNGQFPPDPFGPHYASFYGGDEPLVRYRSGKPSGRNLLVIGSSFSQSVELYVAAHYKNTYAADLRNYKGFSLGELIQTYKLDDVLVLDNSRAIDKPEWMITP